MKFLQITGLIILIVSFLFSKTMEVHTSEGLIEISIDKIDSITFNIKASEDTCIDYDGNKYPTVKIGNQIWTTVNFRCTHYNDGSPIPHLKEKSEWINDSKGALCYYNNDSLQYANQYGAFYNWFSINTGKLAPEGWHIPSDEEWTKLEEYLISNGYNWDNSLSGNKIGKSMASKTDFMLHTKEGSVGSNKKSNNSSGFNGLAAGHRIDNGNYTNFSTMGYWWSTTRNVFVYFRSLRNSEEDLLRHEKSFNSGLSIRLIKDTE